MYTRVFAVIVLTGVFSAGVVAQEWTVAEQEVMTAIEACWDAWGQAVEAKDYSLFSEPCLASDKTRFWWTEWSSPNSTRELRRGMALGLFDWNESRAEWSAIRPLAITMDGDRALVYYTPLWQNETKDGKVNYFEQRRLEVWKKINGSWKQLGGMGSPVSDD